MFIGSMRRLEYLTLLQSNFSGRIPNNFGNLKNLHFLDLSFNSIDLQMNDDISWISKLHSLKHLDLGGVRLKETHNLFQVLNTLPSLLHLSLSNCGIEYSLIPPYAFQNMTSLVYLDLSLNDLHGPILESFQNMTSIETLYLSGNNIASIPSWFGEFEKLTLLDLSYNGLHGQMPHAFTNLSSLVYLGLSLNQIDSIPSLSFGNLKKLVFLDLSSNRLYGPIPEAFRNMTSVESLYLSSNNFALVPWWICKLEKLTLIDLSSNGLHGPIPEAFRNMTSIESLDLSENSLTSIPPWLAELKRLVNLNLGGNQLTLTDNLDLSNNNLSGEIPNCWKDNQEWSEIKLSSNKLTGEFPSSFGNLSSLFWLHLNNNSLQGEFPVSFTNLKQLLILDLGENQLSGSITSSWTTNTFPSLQVLRLRQNMLSGSIPSQLCQLKSLQILDLSRNKLQGSIPRCIGNLEGMKLEKSISSSVPVQSYSLIADAPQIWSNEFLTEADALSPSSTALAPVSDWSTQDVTQVVKGMELEYTKNLKLVVNMDLSQNKLVGFIPNEITWLTGLHGLNLSKNQLKGEIPQLIGDMISLESLDISQNQLSGTIPNTMSALTSLSHLNLSHNNISGSIPKVNQFSTFNDPSIYAYNPYLCGSPLPNMCHTGDISHRTSETKGDEDDNEEEKVLFYFVIALGFATGLWGVIGTLWFKKNWRHAYFRRVEDVADKIYVAVVIKVPKIKKKMRRNHVNG
ncbi:hypothetical protein TSUD_44620 [Trifolium subterraneum]|nr:hypothetical protein TSUD_44620 [Trifolium subterraneum]